MSQFIYECPDCGQSGAPRATDCCDTCIDHFFGSGLGSRVVVAFDKENFESCLEDYSDEDSATVTARQWEFIRHQLQSRLEALNEELVTDIARDVLEGVYNVCESCGNIKTECTCTDNKEESK